MDTEERVTLLKNNMKYKWRLVAVLVVLAILTGVVTYSLFTLQIVDEKGYKRLALEQYTVETSVAARRGIIYDSNMNVLAKSVTVERIFISPVDMVDHPGEAEAVCKALSEILDVDYDKIYERSQKVNRKDETVKAQVDEETADKVREFIKSYSAEHGYTLKSIHFAEAEKRYYPYGTLAAQTIGFTGTDNNGLLGIELQYDTYLQGKSGKIITSKNGAGDSMPTEYESYIDATNGANIVSTIDVTVQSILEKYLYETYVDNEVNNRVCGAVMNVKTGAILAIATVPSFDLNDPYKLNEDALKKAEEYAKTEKDEEKVAKKRTELLYQSWANKMVSELYEPGSTFKVMTATMALEDKVVSRNTPFYCGGSLVVKGSKISCHKRGGHGDETFETGLQNSCNPVFMLTAARLGVSRFYYYFDGYGYTGESGIDLPGEAQPLYVEQSGMHDVELAVYSFGQTFKVTPIQQLRSLSAVANGGYLVTPHVVDKIIDNDGNVLFSADTGTQRQIVSTETCELVSEMLEGGVISGSAKNAYVSGYRIAAKTGTSQKQDKFAPDGTRPYRIGSTVAYGPLEDPEIAIMFIVDEPGNGEIYGSVVAAPYLAKALSEIFPYLGYEPVYNESETMITVGKYTGKTVEYAKTKLGDSVNVIVKGDGDTIISQIPAASSSVYTGATVVLYTSAEEYEEEYVTVPNLMGKTAAEVNTLLTKAGLNLNVEGSYLSGTAVVISQSSQPNEKVKRGTIVSVEFRYYDVGEDDYD